MCVCANPGTALCGTRQRRRLLPRSDLGPANTSLIKVPQDVSLLTLSAKAGMKTGEANARESLILKRPCGLAQLYLRVSRPIQPVS